MNHRTGVRERFYQKAGSLTSTGCQEWQGKLDPSGYGRICVDGKYEQAHRIAWELDHGEPVPPGLLVCHTCHNKSCVAPAHLHAGTHRDNALDTIRAGRANIARGSNHYLGRKTHCLRGHPFDAANTYRPPGNRFRGCRTCVSANAKRRYAARRRPLGSAPSVLQVGTCYHPLGTFWGEFSGGGPLPIFGQTYLAMPTGIIAKSINPYPRD